MLESLEKLHRECEFLLISGKHKEALQKYEDLSKVSCDPFVWAARAKLLENLHREDEAVEIFEKAIQMNQGSGQARLEMVRLILEMKEEDAGLLKKIAEKSLKVLESKEELCQTCCIDKKNSQETWNQEKTVLDFKDKEPSWDDKTVAGESCKTWDEEQTILNSKEENRNIEQDKTVLNPRNPQEDPISTFVERGLPPRQSENNLPISDSLSPDLFYIENKTQKIPYDDVPQESTSFSVVSDIGKDSSAGTKFARYKIIKKLGEGGMGIVYKVYDPQVDRVVALKVVRSDTVSTPEQAARFLQEVKATARLEHPGIVRIYDFGNAPQHYFTMEYITGKTLSDLIHEEIFRCKKAAKILKSICSAIACAHKAKIIHRDLKPSNIMVDEAGNIKVMDFGLAKMEGERSLSRTGDILGTPVYMPPEQASGQKNDYRSDIYSLGAIGYEMITGKPVFKGENIFNILHQVANVDPVRPQSVNANIDIELDTILLKCLEKSPDKRYQSVEDLDEELTRYLEDRPILAKPPDTVARVKKWVKRHKEISAAICIFFLAILGGFGVLIWLIITTTALGINSDMASNIMRWNMQELSYEKDVKPHFEKRVTRCNLFYRYWGEFFFRYSEFHPAEQEKCYKEAEEKLKLAISDAPKEYISLYYLAMIYRAWGKTQEADEYFYRLLKLVKEERKNPNAIQNEFHHVGKALEGVYALNDIQEKEKIILKIHEIIANLKESVRFNGNFFCSLNAIGEFYQRLASYAKEDKNHSLENHYLQEAEKFFGRSLQVGPTYVIAYVNRSNLLFQKALKELENNGTEENALQNIHLAWKDLQKARSVSLKGIHTKSIYYSSLRLQLLLQQKEEIKLLLQSQENTFKEEILKELEKDKTLEEFKKYSKNFKNIDKVWNYMLKNI
ncbi:MAG: protein kinase [Candidatus Brocadiae bacterium]|nr:protein kinase [Candidatus Brocadiia bacterium]